MKSSYAPDRALPVFWSGGLPESSVGWGVTIVQRSAEYHSASSSFCFHLLTKGRSQTGNRQHCHLPEAPPLCTLLPQLETHCHSHMGWKRP